MGASVMGLLANYHNNNVAAEDTHARSQQEIAESSSRVKGQDLEQRIREQQLKDAEIQRQIYADMAHVPTAQPAAAPAAAPSGGPAPNPASPTGYSVGNAPTTPPFLPTQGASAAPAPAAPVAQQAAPAFEPLKMLAEYYKRGGSPTGGAGWLEHLQKIQKGALDYTKETAAIEAEKNAKIGELYLATLQTPPEQRAAVFQAQILPALNQIEPDHDHSKTPLDDVGLRAAIGVAQHGASLAARDKSVADLAHVNAQTGNELAKTDETKVATKAKQQEIANTARITAASQLATSMTPQQYDAKLAALPPEIASAFPPAAEVFDPNGKLLATGAARVLNAGRTPQQQVESQESAAKLTLEEKRAAEAVRHNKAEEGLSGGQLSVARNREAREQKVFDATYGAGANPALVGVPPQQRGAALKEAQKAGADYLSAQQRADEMQNVIDLVRGGNKAAGANLPLLGVNALNALNGIKRINKAEIEQYGNAGNLLDSIQGKMGKLVTGKPVDESVLKDIEALHTELRKHSDKAYEDKLANVNHNYGSSFTPTKRGGATAPAKAIRARDPQGTLHEAPAGTPLPAGWKLEP